MKAILLFTTLWCGLVSFDLPNVNTSNDEGGKNIKAKGISTPYLFPPDSNVFVITPEFRLTDPGNYKITTVVIDPGHGGHDPGCLGHNTREKHVVLAIGNHLAAGLKAQFPGLNVIMTRSTDVFVPLHERAAIATDSKADLFISIHCNAFSNSAANGTETYVLGLHASEENLEVAKRENEAILLEENYQENYGYDPNSPEAHIMFSMFQNAFLEQSIAFAEKVQGHAHDQTKMKNRGVKQAGFLVLRYATMPSVLIETGYLTNGSNEQYLMTDEGQRKMANAIQDSFTEYKREMERAGQESAATVSYIEVTKKTPNVPNTRGNAIEPAARKETYTPEQEAFTASNTFVLDLKKEEEKAKKWGLEIAPPSNYPVPANNTNTSPNKSSKITPNQPVYELEEVVAGNKAPSTTGNMKTSGSKKEENKTYSSIKPIKDELKKMENPSPNIQFCIQLAASPKPINVQSGKWSRIEQTVEVVQESSLYKYQVRNFATLADANKVRSEMRSKGFNDAFVVAYKDGQRVDPRKL